MFNDDIFTEIDEVEKLLPEVFDLLEENYKGSKAQREMVFRQACLIKERIRRVLEIVDSEPI